MLDKRQTVNGFLLMSQMLHDYLGLEGFNDSSKVHHPKNVVLIQALGADPDVEGLQGLGKVKPCFDHYQTKMNQSLALSLVKSLGKLHGPGARWRSEEQASACLMMVNDTSKHLIIAMPTGSGKGDLLVLAALTEVHMGISIHLVPTTSLLHDFHARYSRHNLNTCIFTTDDDSLLRGYGLSIILVTYEQASSLSFITWLNMNRARIRRIVWDECHVLTEWSNFCLSFSSLGHFFQLMADKQHVFLSATLPLYLQEHLMSKYIGRDRVWAVNRVTMPCSRNNISFEVLAYGKEMRLKSMVDVLPLFHHQFPLVPASGVKT